MRRLVNFAMLLVYFIRGATASYCYSDCFYPNATKRIAAPGFQCSSAQLPGDEDCTDLTFEDYSHYVPEGEIAKFSLRAYTYKYKRVAFNLSVTNADFCELVVHFQMLNNQNHSARTRIKLYGNETEAAPKQLDVSCLFSNETSRNPLYRLDYFVIRGKDKYSKRYIFNEPLYRFIREDASIKEYRPFVYADVSNILRRCVSIHIQPLPETYNVTWYKIWLIKNDTNAARTFNVTGKHDFWYNFDDEAGVFYFKVAPMHSECGYYGCANSSTPNFIITEPSRRLLIMIISTVWIPPVLLYALYHLIYKLYRKEAFKRGRKPKCLLIYSPSRLLHVNAMMELAKYLRTCNIDAMIDVLDATDNTDKNAERWYDDAFRSADTVLVATSPPPKKLAVSAVYQNSTDSYLLKLVKENQSERGKRCYIVQLPYCKADDVPEETRHLRRFSLPKELSSLVNVIYRTERVKYLSTVSDEEFLNSVKLANDEIVDEGPNVARDEEETGKSFIRVRVHFQRMSITYYAMLVFFFFLFLFSETLITLRNVAVPNNEIFWSDGDGVSQSLATNINGLYLLGEKAESKKECIRESSRNDGRAISIEKLNL
ncbi:unnamed protein product [Xylocopa violacea]|uniref:SEFIR domain-containing protein n=1 Tax=Xylocopa violacea TaxID=135666 RepID=A0ABP1P9P9_XYLVO